MSGLYAQDTSVSVDRSKADIEATLRRYNADQFGYMAESNRAAILFRISNRQVRIILPLPDKTEKRFWTTPGGRRQRDEDGAHKEWEQACRSSWRSLCLVVKAKLEACAAGISTIEREFFADIVMPNGKTLGEWAAPQIELAYKNNKMPPLLVYGGKDT